MTAPRTARPDPERGAGLSLVETVRRLRVEFAGALDAATVTRVVRGAYRDLAVAGSPDPALPELVERLARVDLADLTRE